MAIQTIEVQRFSLTRSRSFEAVVASLKAGVGRLDLAAFASASTSPGTWSRIGFAMRLTMAAYLQSGAGCEAGKRCLTAADFESEFRKNVEDYARQFYLLDVRSGSPPAVDAARQCALGNPSACASD